MIFYILITVLIVYKLISVLGTRNEDDEKRKQAIDEFFKQKYGAKIVQPADNIVDVTAETKNNDLSLDVGFNVSNTTKKALMQINFNEKDFLDGAESAIDMINEAFSNKDLNTLKEMLAGDVYSNFANQIETLNSQKRTVKSSLISVKNRKITGISLDGSTIKIDVLFEMEQINFVEDENKNVILGNKKRIDLVKESWTFNRNVYSKENFWIVSDIESLK